MLQSIRPQKAQNDLSQQNNTNFPDDTPGIQFLKPVIYLYPTQTTDVTVDVIYAPGFSVTYPPYLEGWKVTAFPDGKIINKFDGREYSYLYWEGNNDTSAEFDLSKGFVVDGNNTAQFLQKTLSGLGLQPKEYNEFIVYWYPKIKSNEYNLIHFATKEEYFDRVQMEITPTPDSILRIFMVIKPLLKPITVDIQELKEFTRKGITVVEWGGTIVE